MRPGLSELEAAGTFGDLTALGSDQDDIDPRLSELAISSAADDGFAKLKDELPPAPPQSKIRAQTCGREQEGGPR